MTHFKETLAYTLIKCHYDLLKMEAKKAIYEKNCYKEGCLWKVRTRLKDNRLTAIRYCGDHTYGGLTLGSNHTMATREWIAHKTEGLYDS